MKFEEVIGKKLSTENVKEGLPRMGLRADDLLGHWASHCDRRHKDRAVAADCPGCRAFFTAFLYELFRFQERRENRDPEAVELFS
jgi:hypothetical protein